MDKKAPTFVECCKTLETLQPVFEKINDWTFAVFDLNRLSNGYPLTHLGLQLFRNHKLIERLAIQEELLFNFLRSIDESYLDVPYHNCIHAADVTQTLNFLLVQSDIISHLTEFETLAVLLSAIVHDVHHPGLTNLFLVQTYHPYAVLYNDQSVLENHHCSEAFRMLLQPENNFLDQLPETRKREVRDLVVYLVLNTDFRKHLKFVNRFQDLFFDKKIDWNDQKQRKQVLLMALKCSDVSHGAKSNDLHLQWTNRISDEFFRQGDVEKALGMSVSAGMDRNETDVGSEQQRFLKGMVIPIYSILVNQFPSTSICFDQLQHNLVYWSSPSSSSSSSPPDSSTPN
eukprot:TRINITY_DN3615_c1_g1_i1.p1 TRINITY_DN3615_c1_g1~~TRINITY_DN3615_c1_g1_i1.p1  ORF type:complete len:343 (-),score=141.59 TRINITY_DN3615_c1_g1_i1:145-1173(-)